MGTIKVKTDIAFAQSYIAKDWEPSCPSSKAPGKKCPYRGTAEELNNFCMHVDCPGYDTK